MARPRVVVSACLLGVPVRWDGGHRRSDWLVEVLAQRAEILAVCPEDELGLGVPRPPIQIVEQAGSLRLERVEDGHDLTDDMDRWSRSRLDRPDLVGIRGFVLKARSPSCGYTTTPVIGLAEAGTTSGRFAAAVAERFGGCPIVDEEALESDFGRRRFLAALYLPDAADSLSDLLAGGLPELAALRDAPARLLDMQADHCRALVDALTRGADEEARASR